MQDLKNFLRDVSKSLSGKYILLLKITAIPCVYLTIWGLASNMFPTIYYGALGLLGKLLVLYTFIGLVGVISDKVSDLRCFFSYSAQEFWQVLKTFLLCFIILLFFIIVLEYVNILPTLSELKSSNDLAIVFGILLFLIMHIVTAWFFFSLYIALLDKRKDISPVLLSIEYITHSFSKVIVYLLLTSLILVPITILNFFVLVNELNLPMQLLVVVEVFISAILYLVVTVVTYKLYESIKTDYEVKYLLSKHLPVTKDS